MGHKSYDCYDPTEEMYAAEGRVYIHLARRDVAAALAEVESWTSWPLDLMGRWLVIEAYFQSQRRDFVPVLERMLLDGVEQREGNIAQMEAMIESARAWPRNGE